MNKLKQLFDSDDIATIDAFLNSDVCLNDYNFCHLIGMNMALHCCSSYIPETELAELLTGEVGEGFDIWFNDDKETSPVRIANNIVSNTLGELLYDGEFNLEALFPASQNAKNPCKGLADFCMGFSLALNLTIEQWQEDFDQLLGIPDFAEAENIVAETETSFDIINTVAHWQQALAQQEGNNAEKLQQEFYQFPDVISGSLHSMFKLALLIEDIRMNGVNQPQMPFQHQQPKIGRNDLCPCGSGKKYKKCCLH